MITTIIWVFLTRWYINIPLQIKKDASCDHLSILTIVFHVSMTHFNNLLLKIQMLSNWTIIFSPWKLVPPKYHLTLIRWKSTYMVLLCLPWNTRFSYFFWVYVLLQILNKHFTIQSIDGTLFGQYFWVTQACLHESRYPSPYNYTILSWLLFYR
jgi:hypothetical protein